MAVEGWRDRVLAEIERQGTSMEAVSLKAGYSHGYLHGILKNRQNPALPKLVRVCEVLGVSFIWITLGVAMDPTHERLLMLMTDLPEEEKAALLKLAESLVRVRDRNGQEPPPKG